MTKLTGEIRYRPYVSSFTFHPAKVLLVLQVEETNDDTEAHQPGPYWRDAKVEDLPTLKGELA